jgi:ABC-type branched-subunit amino acid transport system permease subunit
LLILCIIFMPQGIVGAFKRVRLRREAKVVPAG